MSLRPISAAKAAGGRVRLLGVNPSRSDNRSALTGYGVRFEGGAAAPAAVRHGSLWSQSCHCIASTLTAVTIGKPLTVDA